MSKMSDMTEYHASAYRLPSGFEHCSKLKPVAEAATALDRVKAVVDVLYSCLLYTSPSPRDRG